MNKKGNVQAIVIIGIIILILFAAGIINVDKIKEVVLGESHEFLTSVNTTTLIINEGQDITFSIIVFNPLNSDYLSLTPYLNVSYNNSAFSTRNYDLRNNRRISLENVRQGEKIVYYLSFESERYRSEGEHTFIFYISDSLQNGNLIDKREVKINVR